MSDGLGGVPVVDVSAPGRGVYGAVVSALCGCPQFVAGGFVDDDGLDCHYSSLLLV